MTNFLHLIIEDSELSTLDPPLVYQGFYDPAVVREAIERGVGSSYKTSMGSKFDAMKSRPVEATVTVKSIQTSWAGANNADLALLSVNGVDVVVASKHVGCYDPEMMRTLGVEPEERKVIVVKLGYLEPEIRAIAKRSMMALTTGSTDELFVPPTNLRADLPPGQGV